ncbi:Diphthine synthase [Smittium culicis]|uniref:diphthine methyl ester synthase n=1 Tax=Smittium culicis TaxID=133412 RepID=A0A1R1XYT7_9FUNG|nr:Diphthine synthase [Smittium culicis]
MLYIIGLGLFDEQDITVRGLKAIQSCDRVYLEAYTSILLVEKEKLEELYGKPVIVADREMVEQQSDEILREAKTKNVAFLVVGDPYGATTHTDLELRARSEGIPVRAIHNASVMNAIGAVGLQLYNFGQTISMVFFTETWRPDSWYDRIAENARIGLHTLVLLDIKVKEQSVENMARGRLIYEPPRYMTTMTAIEQLLDVHELRMRKRDGEIDSDAEEEEQQNNKDAIDSDMMVEAYNGDTLAVAVARLGSDSQEIKVGTLNSLRNVDLGKPLHSLVIVGKRLHMLERDIMREYAVDRDEFDHIVSRDYNL